MSPQILAVILFILLAVYYLQKAIHPNACRSLGWGRTGGKVPVSRLGYAVWGSTFIAIAVTLIKSDDRPSTLVIILVGNTLLRWCNMASELQMICVEGNNFSPK